MRHILPRRDVCHSLRAKYLHIHIPNQKLKKQKKLLVSLHALFFWSFLRLARKQEIQRSQARGRELLETAQQTRRLNQEFYLSVNLTNCANKIHYSANQFFFWILNDPFCTFKQIVASWHLLVRSLYLQMHWIINVIQILQRGFENVLISRGAFPLTNLHTPVHL